MLEAVGGAVRSLADGEAEDLYFTVAPPRLGSAADQARHVYRSVRDALAAAGVAADKIELSKPQETTGGADGREARRVEITAR